MKREAPPSTGVVTTILDRCRRCYSCVRGCPAKAIRVQGGQAHVIEERCIGCGTCVKVCRQKAKQVLSALPATRQLLGSGRPVAAVVAPSYPAALPDASAGQIVAALRQLGFAGVYEVGFGADMVAREYARLARRRPKTCLISTPCPALVSYVRKYAPDLVPNLVPIVSPMAAMARVVRGALMPNASVVFIGPCIAKKAELRDGGVAGNADAAMTFTELDELLRERGIDPGALPPSAPDEPLPGLGALFPITGGLLRAAALRADLTDDTVVPIDGPRRCIDTLRALERGALGTCFVDALWCEGCVGGPGYPQEVSPLARRRQVTEHVRALADHARSARRSLKRLGRVDLSREFRAEPLAAPAPTEKEIRDVLARTGKLSADQELDCGACGYPTCRDKAIAVYQGLAENEMCLPYLIEQLEVNIEKLSRSRDEIGKAREAAVRAQRLASMGDLAADVAQEISEPLGRLVVFAQVFWDSLGENDPRRPDLADIIVEAARCRDVLAALEQFARQQKPEWEEVNLSELLDRALIEIRPHLTGTRIDLACYVEPGLPTVLADSTQLRQVLSNLLSNSVEAIGQSGRIWVQVRGVDDGQSVEISVRDTGRGIPPDVLPRIFQPFVTTKPRAHGSGLGLAVAHGIVQGHGGEITVDSRMGGGTEVKVRLPVSHSRPPASDAMKVLVVDDDPDFLEQHRLTLADAGFDVITAERSDEALDAANREIPDAFVLDLIMERTDSGARLARALRRDPRFRDTPIVILTSVVHDVGFEFHRNPEEVLAWMKADAWFDKPAPVQTLASTIRRIHAERLATREPRAPEAPEQVPAHD